MHVKLTSKYYLIRIAKSKDLTDLLDALAAYNKFKRERSDFAVRHYCDSIRKGDVFGVAESFLIPAY